MEKFALAGKVALVTGGSRGLGRAMALGLAEASADVVVVSHTGIGLEEVVRAIESRGRHGLAITGNVAISNEARQIIHKVITEFSHLDILINAAGVNRRIPTLEIKEDEWDWIVGVNLKGTFFMCQAAGEVMIRQRRGSIINVASLLSEVGIPTLAPYAAAKAGVVGLTRVLAAEWGPYGVRVNAIGPGYFRTHMTERLFSDPGWVERLLQQVPLGRAGDPQDLVGVAVFLASDASAYLTGQVIYVDGGYLCARPA
ncbi:MAG: glucose 1-dehydrogenase [Candidatus Hadarchaeum sp.]|uniref:glucose 1-dehydrogenase n=1 Tax=Candidatus Hadarchaeum sp. TaxID=2883567 RepID=UPI003175C6B3